MLRNYFTIAFRSLLRARVFSAMTILSLSISLASCVLIIYYVHNELTYDHFHQAADRTYRLSSLMDHPGGQDHMAITADLLGPELKTGYTQIENYVRFEPFGKHQVKFLGEMIEQEGFSITDPQVFDVFDYELIAGNPAKALSDPLKIVLSESTAAQYFGIASASLNKTLEVDGKLLTVTGIFKDLPDNTVLPRHGLIGSVKAEQDPNAIWKFNTITYIVLKKDITSSQLNSILAGLSKKHEPLSGITFRAQPLNELHFISGIKFDSVKGNKNYIFGFATVAAILICIVLFNYINLSTVKSMERYKEVGIRKVVGARPYQLTRQFMGESLFILILSAVLAFGFIQLLQPAFTAVTGKVLEFSWERSLLIMGAALMVLVMLALFASVYPAFVLSSFKPVSILRGKSPSFSGGSKSRKVLLVAQFTLCSAVLISFAVIFAQFRYIQKYDLGFSKEDIVGITLPADSLSRTRLGYLTVQLSKAGFDQVTFTSRSGNLLNMEHITEQVKIHSAGQDIDFNVNAKEVDGEFLDVMHIPLVQGKSFRDFSWQQWNDKVLVNESFVKDAGWKNPIGEKIQRPFDQGTLTVIGVIKDFHITSLHNPIEPVMMQAWNFRGLPYDEWQVSPAVSTAFIKANAGALPDLRKVWSEVFPDKRFDYYFMDDAFEKQYAAEQKTITLFIYFAVLSLVITGMGLYALTAYQVELRTKEIGIRKILGADLRTMIHLLSKESLALIGLGSLLGLLLSWNASQWWLAGFSYKVSVTGLLLFTPVLLLLLFAAAIISLKVFQAADANPVDSLRNE
ncbi:MAG TPA: ABC transporter permease [Ohtaekwangia sp.]